MKPISIEEIVRSVHGTLLCGESKDTAASVSIHSKEVQKGSLFVPLIGEKVDAHTFIEDAVSLGAAAVFTAREDKKEACMGKCACILVEDTKKALQDFAAYYRSLFSIPVIGITGSVGKTTTKEMTAAALSVKYRVLKTEGNKNSQVGLALMMFAIEEDTQIAVMEMGMSEPGEMERLSVIARPETAIITNIGVSHIGQLGSRENIRREKMDIIKCFGENGVLYLNADDDLLAEAGNAEIDLSKAAKQALAGTSLVFYGLSGNADARAEKMETNEDGVSFEFVCRGKRVPVFLPVFGTHNVLNALAALCVAWRYGIGPEEAKEGLKTYAPIAMRGQLFRAKGIAILDDTYNASPDSMKSGIDTLLNMNGLKRRFAVLGDILELGEASFSCHYEVGSYIASRMEKDRKVDGLVTVGSEAEAIAQAARESAGAVETASFSTREDAILYLKEHLREGDGVFIKGSRGMQMEKIVAALRE